MSSRLKVAGVSKSYVLTEPVEFAGERIYQLEFRPLKVRDHIEIERDLKDAGNIEKACAYLQRLTRQDPTVIENLSHHDFMGAMQIMEDFFLEKSQKTTQTT